MRWFIALAFVLVTTASLAQDIAPGRSGGLAPAPDSGFSREALVRAWDLDHDGTISPSEADVARARMKRERLNFQNDAGLDPITGLPRSEKPDPTSTDREFDSSYELPPEIPRDNPKATPGTKPGTPQGSSRPKTIAELAAPITPTSSQPGPSGGVAPTPPGSSSPASAERSSRASWLPAQAPRTAGTGGPRAGAPPAVSGYGSGAWSDLNAGRPIPAVRGAPPATSSEGRTGLAGGGLLPSARAPGQTGALILPSQTMPRIAPRQSLPPPPSRPASPRITAEDIGDYRP